MQLDRIEKLADEIIKREGGYVNDPDDPGGVTNFGVTLGTLEALSRDINDDGRVDWRDVKALSKAQAREIYIEQYFYGPKLDLLPQELWPSVFDMQVNAGAQAVVILQKMLTKMGFSLATDGKVGPKTARACAQALQVDEALTCDAYGIERRNFYFRLAQKRPSLRKFARTRRGSKGGWIRRAEAFLRPEFHLRAEEFNAITRGWS